MESCLALTPEEARTYSLILDAASQLPKSDPRYGFVIGMTWWLLHRRRRLEQQRIRRRQFYRRWRRMLVLRWQMQKNVLTSVSMAMKASELAGLEDLDSLPEKRLWVKKDRTDDLWSQIESGEISEEEFRRHFHMSKDTFNFLYNELEEHLTKANTTMREPIPGKKRLAATIYRLATNAEYLKVSNYFGIGKSTTTSLVRDVCEIIVVNLKDKYLNFTPGTVETEQGLEERVKAAEKEFEIPQCIGVVGCTDVLIVGSSWDWSDTSPYKSIYSKHYALVFQGVVNDEGQFNHVSAGSPASLPNSIVLQRSKLKQVMTDKFSEFQQCVEGLEVPIVLAAYDASFGCPRQNWLLTPFENHEFPSDPQTREKFNEKMEVAKHVFDEAILKLRSRCKIFHGRNGKINFNVDAFENISLACCIVHNICEMRNDEIDEMWSSDVIDRLLIRSSLSASSSNDPDDSGTSAQAQSQNTRSMDMELEQEQDHDHVQDEENENGDEQAFDVNAQSVAAADAVRKVLAFASLIE